MGTFNASSIMRSKIDILDVNNTIYTAADIITNKTGVYSVLVSEGDEIIGIIVEKDLLKAWINGKDLKTTKAKEIMSTPLEFCDYDDNLTTCKNQMEKTQKSRLIVKKDGVVVGILHKKFVLKNIAYSRAVSSRVTHVTTKHRQD